jgi:4-amino-4-deoxy-L-arabinose transferase-like glycosyltransferase
MVAVTRNQARQPWLAPLGIFCAGLFLFTFGLSNQEVIGFESRFYLFALEMWRHGPSWFPTINGTPYPDYPATATLLIYGLAKLVGHLNKWVAVFPSAVAASATLVVTYLIGSLHNKRLGYLAVLFLFLTVTFLGEARTISSDQYTTLFTALIFYLAHSADLLKKSLRLYFIPVLLLAGFAFRGPIGLVIPAAVLVVYYLSAKNIGGVVNSIVVSLMTLAIGTAALCAVAHHVGGSMLVCNVLHTQVFGRLQAQNVPWYFYFTESMGAYALTYPLVLLFMAGLLADFKARRKNKTFLLQLCGWVAIIIVGMTIPEAKKIRYILPFAPALALLCAYLFSVPQKQTFLRGLQKWTYWLLYFVPWLLMALIIFFEGFVISHHWRPQILFVPVIALFMILQWLSWIVRKNILHVFTVSALAMVMFYILIVEPVNLLLNRTHALVMSVEILRNHNHADLVFYQENPDGLPIKYLANLQVEVKPVFISTPEQLSTYTGRAYFITDRDYFSKIPRTILHSSQIVYTGSIGHDEVVVFEKIG